MADFGQFWVKEPRQFRKNISHEKRHLYRVARVIFQVCVQRIFDQTKVSVRNAVSWKNIYRCLSYHVSLYEKGSKFGRICIGCSGAILDFAPSKRRYMLCTRYLFWRCLSHSTTWSTHFNIVPSLTFSWIGKRIPRATPRASCAWSLASSGTCVRPALHRSNI